MALNPSSSRATGQGKGQTVNGEEGAKNLWFGQAAAKKQTANPFILFQLGTHALFLIVERIARKDALPWLQTNFRGTKWRLPQ